MEDQDRWHVLLRDDTEIDEEDEQDGVIRLRGWAEVDAAQVALLQIREGPDIVASVVIPDKATPVFFRRRSIAIQVNPDEDVPHETGRTTVTIIGWQTSEGLPVWLWRSPEGVVVLSQGDLHG